MVDNWINNQEKKLMKNQVIKVLNIEHGEKVIKYWKDKGVNTGKYTGCVTAKDGDKHIYYGVIDGCFSNYMQNQVIGCEIIEIPSEIIPNDLPKKGEVILVWDYDEQKPSQRIFLDYIPQSKSPVICVIPSDETNFTNGEKVGVNLWINYKKFIPEFVELTLDDISAGKGVGVDPKLIRIKK